MPLQIASNDDSGSSQLSKLTFEALPDTDYYVSVEGYSTFCGEVDVQFVVNSLQPPPPPTPGKKA